VRMPRIKSKEQLEDLVRDSVSFGEIARKLDYKTVKNGKFPGGVYKPKLLIGELIPRISQVRAGLKVRRENQANT
jgi:hypothetical protein